MLADRPLSFGSNLDNEARLVGELVMLFQETKAIVTARLAKTDDARKLYQDAHQCIFDYDLAEGVLVYRQQRRIGKLLPGTEGPYAFVRYTGQA